MTPDEMIQVTRAWVDPTSDAHLLILEAEGLAGLLPRVTATHEGLEAALQPGEDPRDVAIVQAQAKLSVRRDAILHEVWGTLTQEAELMGRGKGATLIFLRDAILPDGLGSQLQTCSAEVGQAQRVAHVMTAALRAQTDAITIGQGPGSKPLTGWIEELIQLGQQLGALEDEHGQRLGTRSDGESVRRAQLAWVGVVEEMVATAELGELDEESKAIIFGEYRAMLVRAGERARGVGGGEGGGGGGEGGRGEG